jgi:flagellar biosynthesis/type III secretory pathway M-ring protein FliF/YscJ
MTRVRSSIWDRFKGGVAVVLALLVFFFGVRSVRADGADPQNTPAQATDNERPPTDDTGPEGSSGTPANPRLQLQDEPATREGDFARRSRARANDEIEERPFWKNWIFWTVTGVLVAGIVGMVVYTSAGTNTSLAPCPADVVVSLGCFGTGR